MGLDSVFHFMGYIYLHLCILFMMMKLLERCCMDYNESIYRHEGSTVYTLFGLFCLTPVLIFFYSVGKSADLVDVILLPMVVGISRLFFIVSLAYDATIIVTDSIVEIYSDSEKYYDVIDIDNIKNVRDDGSMYCYDKRYVSLGLGLLPFRKKVVEDIRSRVEKAKQAAPSRIESDDVYSSPSCTG